MRAAVAQVVADLSGDGRRRVGAEGDAAARVVAVDGLDEADRPDLDEVLERLLARVPAGQRADEREMALDELAAGRGDHRPTLTGRV
jgi:hypothetical protein